MSEISTPCTALSLHLLTIDNQQCGSFTRSSSMPFRNQIFHVLGLTSGDLGRTPTVLYFILLSTLSRMPWSVTKNIVFTFWHITFYTFYVILGTETSCELEGQAKYLHSTYNGRKLFTTFNIMPNFCSSLNNCFLVLFVNSLSLIYNRHG